MRLLLAAAFAATFLACGGSSGAKLEPTLAPPPIDPQLQDVGRGELVLHVEAHSKQDIDPLALAREQGTPPACAQFVFLFSWRVTTGPPLKFISNRQGGTDNLGGGPTGQVSVGGCILLEAVNDGDAAADGDLRYFIATPRN